LNFSPTRKLYSHCVCLSIAACQHAHIFTPRTHRYTRAENRIVRRSLGRCTYVCVCICKGVRKNGGLPLAVYWFCRCGYARYFTGYTNTTSADDTYSTQPQRDTHTGAHTIKMIALACDDRMSGGYAMKQPGCIWWMSSKPWTRCDNSNAKIQHTHTRTHRKGCPGA